MPLSPPRLCRNYWEWVDALSTHSCGTAGLVSCDGIGILAFRCTNCKRAWGCAQYLVADVMSSGSVPVHIVRGFQQQYNDIWFNYHMHFKPWEVHTASILDGILCL